MINNEENIPQEMREWETTELNPEKVLVASQ